MALGVSRDPLSGAVRSNQAATGKKLYGPGLSTRATAGPVDKTGYRERDLRAQVMRNAIKRMR